MLGSCAVDGKATSVRATATVVNKASACTSRSQPLRRLQTRALPHAVCGIGARRITQPSSWCSNTVSETSKARPIGTQTAVVADTRPAMPIWRDTSVSRKKPIPPTIPAITIVWVPPDRNDRRDTVAAKMTIAIKSMGRDSSWAYCILYRAAESPAFSATSINAGNCHKETAISEPRASLDTLARQVGTYRKGVEGLRLSTWTRNHCLLQLPVAVGEAGLVGIDALDEPPLGVELKDDHADQRQALIGDRFARSSPIVRRRRPGAATSPRPSWQADSPPCRKPPRSAVRPPSGRLPPTDCRGRRRPLRAPARPPRPGRRNCHTDMPPARMTISSDLRLRLNSAPMPPTSTAKASRISV